MSDFEIESDDEGDSYGHNSYKNGKNSKSNNSKASNLMKSKPLNAPKSFFGGPSAGRSNDDDAYNFDFDAVASKKSYAPERNSPQNQNKNNNLDSGLTKNNNNSIPKTVNMSSESALEKAQNMLNKFDKSKVDVAMSPKRNMFSLRRPSDSFDEDDISLDSDPNESTKRIGSFEESRTLYGSPLLGSFNKDEDGECQYTDVFFLIPQSCLYCILLLTLFYLIFHFLWLFSPLSIITTLTVILTLVNDNTYFEYFPLTEFPDNAIVTNTHLNTHHNND